LADLSYNTPVEYGGNIQIHAPGYREKANRLPLFPLDDAEAVVKAARAQPQVVAASKRINTAGIVSGREGAYPVVITGIASENIAQGRFLLEGDGDAILIGRGLADLLGVTAGDRVNLLGRSKHETMRQRTMTIVGVYDLGMTEAEKGMVFITLPEAQTLYNLRNQATEVTISLQSVGQEKAVVAALQAALPGYEVDSWETLKPEMRQTLDTKLAFTSFFGIVVLLIASIGILNLLLMAVFERTREMGVLAALWLGSSTQPPHSNLLLAVFLPARLFGHSVFCLGLHAFAKLTNSSAQSRPSFRQSTGAKDQQHDDEDDE
jgi:ABC-type lipoprotein release transport system permease subunit